MNLTYGYQVHPGRCISCANSDQTMKVIDWSADDLAPVRRTRVYTCEACITAAYMKLDPTKELIDSVSLANMRGEIASLTNEVARLMGEADAINTRIAKAVVTG